MLPYAKVMNSRRAALVSIPTLLIIVAFGWFWITRSRDTRQCRKRADAFDSRVADITEAAKTTLKIGTKKQDVIRFFAKYDIPVQFDLMAGQQEATGTVFVTGIAKCSPNVGCGDDAALIGVRVDVDDAGTVTGEPVVVGMYTNCA